METSIGSQRYAVAFPLIIAAVLLGSALYLWQATARSASVEVIPAGQGSSSVALGTPQRTTEMFGDPPYLTGGILEWALHNGIKNARSYYHDAYWDTR